jgi:glycosyltransferase involved in cell wall biosynthesis
MTEEDQARWDAWKWYRHHLPEMMRERASSFSVQATPYNAAVRALQSCAEPLPPLQEENLGELVSIIIANFNYGRFLSEAIESAIHQTHPCVEVIVIDDGSTDDSLEVARRYPVTLVPQKNQGVGAARNHGAAIAKGQYLVFLDSDDVLEATYVTHCLEALKQREESVAYAYTGMRYFGAEDRVYCSRPFDAKALWAGNFVHASALVRRNAFERVGGFDPTWRLGHEDYELWVRMLHHGFQGVLVPEPLLHYRRHGAGRNALSREQHRELRWRLRFTYPRFYWLKLLKDPMRSIYFMVQFRGRMHRWTGDPD